MRTPRRVVLGLALATMLLSLLLATAAWASPSRAGWAVSQISSTTAATYPQLQLVGTRVAWCGLAEGGMPQVFTWKAGEATTTKLTSDPNSHNEPNISGDRIVWTDVVGSYNQIFTWTQGDSQPTTLTTDSHHHQQPRIAGDHILWTAADDLSHYQVQTQQVGELTPQTLTDDPHDHYDPSLSTTLAAWTGQDEIGRYQIFTYTSENDVSQLTSATSGTNPRVSGDRLVFSGYDAAGRDQVFTWKRGDASTLTTLTADTEVNSHADIVVSGDRVAWRHEKYDGQGWRVYTWTPSSGVTTIPTSAFAESVRVDGDRIVWLAQNYPLTTWQLCTWKVGAPAPTILSTNVDQNSDPQVAGDTVVWRGQDLQIYSAVFTTHALQYLAGPHGTIAGVAVQSVSHGSSGSTVTAVPDAGYHFVSWSDGVTLASRQDIGVTADITVTAEFVLDPPQPTTTRLKAPGSVKKGKSLKLTGSVAPAGATGKVKIYLTRLVGKKWKSAGTASVSLRSGAFAYSFKPKYKGKWRFRANYLGSAPGFAGSWNSTYATTTVK